MKRRHLLGSFGTVLLAGCTGGETDDSDDTERLQTESQSAPSTTAVPSPTQSPAAASTPSPEPATPEPTPTPEPEPERPTIETVNLVTRWDDFGDATANEISVAGVNSQVVVAFGYQIDIHDNRHDITKQIEINRITPGGQSRVYLDSSPDNQLTESSGLQSWEGSFVADSNGWERGEYEATVIIRDEVTGKTSNAGKAKFDLTRRLDASEVKLSKLESPGTITTGEKMRFTLHIENTSDRDGSIISPVSVKSDDFDWRTYPDETFRLDIKSGSTSEWKSGEISFDEEGTYSFRLDAVDIQWSFSAE